MAAGKQQEMGKTLWNIANTLRGAMMADDFRDYMLSFLFWKYLSDNYVDVAKKNWGLTTPHYRLGTMRTPTIRSCLRSR